MAALLPAAGFDRLIGNVWTAGAGDFVTAEQWRRCIDERLTPTAGSGGRRYWGGLDLGLTKDRTAFAIVHRDGEHVVLDSLDVWQGTRQEPVSITVVERAVADATRRFPGLTISCDPWQLKGSIERLQRERVSVSEFVFSSSSVQKLSTALHQAITSGALRVYPDAELEREILGLRVVESAGGWRFDHRTGGYSDRAVALAMATMRAVAEPVGRGMRIFAPRGDGTPLGGLDMALNGTPVRSRRRREVEDWLRSATSLERERSGR